MWIHYDVFQVISRWIHLEREESMQILIRAPKELKEILQGMAKAMGVTLNAFILQILWDFI